MSSTENLPTCHRQEPQGEETQGPPTCMSYDSGEYSILERLGMPAQSLEQKYPVNTPQIYVTGNYSEEGVHGPYIATSVGLASHDNQMLCLSNDSGFTGSFGNSSKLTMDDSSSSCSTVTTSGYSCEQSPNVPVRQPMSSNFTTPTSVSPYSAGTIYKNYPLTSHSTGYEPIQYSSYSPYFMQAHPAPVAGGHSLPSHHFTSLPPPPEYPGFGHPEHPDQHARRSYEILAKPEIGGSRSQPDMCHFMEARGGSKHLGILHKSAGSGSDKGSHSSLDKR